MQKIYRVFLGAILLAAIGYGIPTNSAEQKSGKTKTPPSSSSGDQLARGKYLVEEVAKCAECHTPRDERGELIKGRWLQGSPIWIKPVRDTSNWGENAPALAGFPGYSDENAIRILEKGVGPNGYAIRPPMHIYHLKHEDAAAIVAYLRSLPMASK